MTSSDPHAPAAATRSVTVRRRLGAIFYDCLALIGIWFVVAGIAVGLHHGEAVPDYTGGFQLTLLGAAFGYFVACWRRGGQTLGMKSWRLRVVDALSGAPLSWGQASLRFGIGLMSWLPLACGVWAWSFSGLPRPLTGVCLGVLAGLYWWVLGGRGEALIDRASRTRLIRL